MKKKVADKAAMNKEPKKNMVKKKASKKKTLKTNARKNSVAKEIKARRLTEEAHPIERAIDKFLHRIWGVEFSVDIFIPKATELFVNKMKEATNELRDASKLLRDDDSSKQIVGVKKVTNTVMDLYVLADSNLREIVKNGHFLSLFSAFDTFTGDLLSAIYFKKPELFNDLNRSITISDMIKYESLEDIKSVVLQYEIESFRRKSYVDQFKDLESRFDIKLREFERWPQFVECTQRRNLLTHCDGIVSDQYLRECRKEGYSFTNNIKVGDKLTLDKEYLQSAFELMLEIGVKLGHTLWRKIFQCELEQADNHLVMITYNLLKREKWHAAEVVGKFANEQKKHANDITKRIFLVNYAIALKFGRKHKKARKVLSSVDWSATSNDFKIAEAVLLGKYENAAKIMKRIGKESELVKEYAYHDWPLFRKFRETKIFLKTYESVYGYPLTVELQRTAEATKADADRKLRKQKQKY